MSALVHRDATGGPFDPDDDQAYQAWRANKLGRYPRTAQALIVKIHDPRALTDAERAAILDRCGRTNMAVYASNVGDNPDRQIPIRLGARFGLLDPDRNIAGDGDGITSLQVAAKHGRNRYIPYSNRPIHWHTDGYYNAPDSQILGLLLHCVRPAERGGENALMDHEIAYIRLRDENPDHVRALMAPDAMTIPANIVNGEEIRPPRSGPVFSVTSTGRLHMRYTARTHSIVWKADAGTRAAVRRLESLLASDDPAIFRLTLHSGWGLISNNVLHNRSGFEDDPSSRRLLYRLRYFGPVR